MDIINSLKSSDNRYETIYIGGGTPSLINIKFYERLLSKIIVSKSAETTIEVNPGTVSYEYLKNLRKIGFNRLSIGVQSFNDDILKILNRTHTSEEAKITVHDAQKAGFQNISIDLIYGLPRQSLDDWKETLYHAINLDVQHISAYGLKIEENTEFYKNPPQELPDEDEVVKMYLQTIKILEENGFEHYEISNFCKPVHESRHNLAYWNNEEYFGFGLSAHGYVNGARYSNTGNLDAYIANPLIKTEERLLTDVEKQEETIFLGLRLRKGIDITGLNGKYDDIIQKYIEMGMMKLENNYLSLTHEGILLSNNILAEFID